MPKRQGQLGEQLIQLGRSPIWPGSGRKTHSKSEKPRFLIKLPKHQIDRNYLSKHQNDTEGMRIHILVDGKSGCNRVASIGKNLESSLSPSHETTQN